MKICRIKRWWFAAAISFAIFFAVVAILPYTAGYVEIRGNLSPKDIAEIKRVHRSKVWPGPYPDWFPMAAQRKLSAILNPVDIICAPSEERAIIVYRGFDNCYYDKEGKHRWGNASYTLVKGPKGWTDEFTLP